MNPGAETVGLVALVADRDIEETLTKLFGRPDALGIRPFPFEIRRHPDRDAGCRTDAANYLRQFLRSYRHALVVFDRDGCGSPLSREEIEGAVQGDLYQNGWEDHGRAVVIDPVWDDGLPKPDDPKAAMIRALRGASRRTRRRRSARIFGEIAAGASFDDCGDPAFKKLKATLREWFPKAGP